MSAVALPQTERTPWGLSQSHQRFQAGLPYAEFEALQASFKVSAQRLAHAIGINPRTLQRRRKDGRFTFVESDRLSRYMELFHSAAEALESEDAAASWLTREDDVFDGLAPLEFASTEPGYLEMRDIIRNVQDDSFG